MTTLYGISKKYILTQKTSFLIFFTLSALSIASTVTLPYLFGHYIDAITASDHANFPYSAIIAILMTAVTGLLSTFMSSIFSTKIHGNAYINYNIDILRHLQSLPLSFFNNKESSYITKRINDDTEEAISFILDNIASLTANTIIIFTILTLLFFKHGAIMPLFFTAGIIADISIYFAFNNSIYRIAYTKKEGQDDFFSHLNENISLIRFIKIQAISPTLHKFLHNKFEELLATFIKYTKINFSYIIISKFTRHLALLLLLVYCGYGVIAQKTSVGDFVLSLAYFMVGFKSLDDLPDLLKKWKSVQASLHRIRHILLCKQENSGAIKISNIKSITSKNIKVNETFNNSNHFTYTFNSGNIYAITGKNGVGKTSFLSSLIGLHPLTNGTVLYNNTDINDIDIDHLRKNCIGFCDQDSLVLNMPIVDNITIGTSSNEAIASHYISMFDLREQVRSNNIAVKSLSGGEKRKISLIRALIKEPCVYLFDEPTSDLDSASVKTLCDILLNQKKKRIIIIITHDERIISISDYVLSV